MDALRMSYLCSLLSRLPSLHSAREQQLVGKHEQERLQWEQEKQALLEQLHQKQPPYKVPQRYCTFLQVVLLFILLS